MIGNLEVYFKSNQFTMTTVTFFVTLEGSVQYQICLKLRILCNPVKTRTFFLEGW